MTEIYTPKDWNSAFLGTPMLAIDESTGKIYRGGDAYKFSREAIGQIDYAQNCIYGADYAKLSRQPIAKLIYDGSTIKVYNWKDIGYDNKPMLVDQPLLYIVNGKIYDHDPRFNIVDDPLGHIGGSRSSGGSGNSSGHVSRGGGFSGIGGWGLILIFVVLTLIFEMIDSFRRNPLMFVGIYIGLILFGFLLAKLFFGIVSLFKGEGFLKGFNTKIIKGLKKGYRGPTIKKKDTANASSGYTPPTQKTPHQNPTKNTPPKPTSPANSKPSKPVTNPEQPKTPSSSKPSNYYEHTYSHTCVKCGKTFYNTTAHPEVKLCSYCAAKIAVESEKKQQQTPNPNANKWFNTCQRCAKDFWSDKGFEEYCDSCKAVINESKKLSKKKDPKYTTYSITCQRCGNTFQSPYQNPANKLCTSCTAKANAEKDKAEKRKKEEELKKNKEKQNTPPQPPVQKPLEFGIFACPKCGANNRGPKGKILTCGNPNCKNKFKAEG